MGGWDIYFLKNRDHRREDLITYKLRDQIRCFT